MVHKYLGPIWGKLIKYEWQNTGVQVISNDKFDIWKSKTDKITHIASWLLHWALLKRSLILNLGCPVHIHFLKQRAIFSKCIGQLVNLRELFSSYLCENILSWGQVTWLDMTGWCWKLALTRFQTRFLLMWKTFLAKFAWIISQCIITVTDVIYQVGLSLAEEGALWSPTCTVCSWLWKNECLPEVQGRNSDSLCWCAKML